MSKKTKAQWAKLQRELTDKMSKVTDETAVVVENVGDALEIWPHPSRLDGTFYYAEELVTFCAYHKLSNWLSVRERDGRMCVFAHIF